MQLLNLNIGEISSSFSGNNFFFLAKHNDFNVVKKEKEKEKTTYIFLLFLTIYILKKSFF